MFEELGIQPPTNYQELVAISKTIREKKNIMPMSFHGKDAWAWPMLFFDTYAQSSGNKSISNVESFLEGKTQFTGDAEQQGFTMIKKLFDDGILTKESLDTDEEGMRAVFAQQKTAMIFGGTWEYEPLKAAVKDFKMGAMEFPLMVDAAGVKAQHAYAVGDDAIEIPSFADQKNLENTMRFVEYFTRTENAQKILSTRSPLFKIEKGQTLQSDEVADFLNQKSVPNSIMFLDWVWPAEVNDAFSQSIPAVVTGNMTAKEAVDTVQKAYETVKTEKNYKYDWWSDWTDADWKKVTPTVIPDVKKFMK
jgi:raffinose/stachyose/melibiose transport system substrate-binding protein